MRLARPSLAPPPPDGEEVIKVLLNRFLRHFFFYPSGHEKREERSGYELKTVRTGRSFGGAEMEGGEGGGGGAGCREGREINEIRLPSGNPRFSENSK